MNWFLKKKIKAEKDSDELEKTKHHFVKLCISLEEKIETLEKELVYWKEKALNFRRFHQ